jgi:hypothetical protein
MSHPQLAFIHDRYALAVFTAPARPGFVDAADMPNAGIAAAEPLPEAYLPVRASTAWPDARTAVPPPLQLGAGALRFVFVGISDVYSELTRGPGRHRLDFELNPPLALAAPAAAHVWEILSGNDPWNLWRSGTEVKRLEFAPSLLAMWRSGPASLRDVAQYADSAAAPLALAPMPVVDGQPCARVCVGGISHLFLFPSPPLLPPGSPSEKLFSRLSLPLALQTRLSLLCWLLHEHAHAQWWLRGLLQAAQAQRTALQSLASGAGALRKWRVVYELPCVLLFSTPLPSPSGANVSQDELTVRLEFGPEWAHVFAASLSVPHGAPRADPRVTASVVQAGLQTKLFAPDYAARVVARAKSLPLALHVLAGKADALRLAGVARAL